MVRVWWEARSGRRGEGVRAGADIDSPWVQVRALGFILSRKGNQEAGAGVKRDQLCVTRPRRVWWDLKHEGLRGFDKIYKWL